MLRSEWAVQIQKYPNIFELNGLPVNMKLDTPKAPGYNVFLIDLCMLITNLKVLSGANG